MEEESLNLEGQVDVANHAISQPSRNCEARAKVIEPSCQVSGGNVSGVSFAWGFAFQMLTIF